MAKQARDTCNTRFLAHVQTWDDQGRPESVSGVQRKRVSVADGICLVAHFGKRRDAARAIAALGQLPDDLGGVTAVLFVDNALYKATKACNAKGFKGRPARASEESRKALLKAPLFSDSFPALERGEWCVRPSCECSGRT